MSNIYKQKILLKHYHNPQNQGALNSCDQKFSGINASCGDELEIYIKLDKRKRVFQVGWTGRGCVISQAAMSIFSELIKGKTIEEIQKMDKDDLLKKLGFELSPNRIKCALLCLYTVCEAREAS